MTTLLVQKNVKILMHKQFGSTTRCNVRLFHGLANDAVKGVLFMTT